MRNSQIQVLAELPDQLSQPMTATAIPFDMFASATRRFVDILICLVLSIAAVPLLVIVALLIKFDSAGPILYSQERLGLNGAPFTMLKMRSMHVGAEAHGPKWAMLNDIRVTRIGRWLRRTRIDELPQIINVLAGTMSIIGPRPERAHFVEQLEKEIPNFSERLVIKPGMTGWAQVNLLYGNSFKEARQKLNFDLHYIRHRSATMDLEILFATMRIIFSKHAAR